MSKLEDDREMKIYNDTSEVSVHLKTKQAEIEDKNEDSLQLRTTQAEIEYKNNETNLEIIKKKDEKEIRQNLLKIKFYRKNKVKDELKNKLEDYLFKKDKENLDDIKKIMNSLNINYIPVLCTIFEFIESKKICFGMQEFGTFDIVYIFENLKKIKDNKVIDLITKKVREELKDINVPELVTILEYLFEKDINYRLNLLNYLNIDINSKLTIIIPQEEIIKKEIYIVILNFYKILQLKGKTNKLDLGNIYLTEQHIQRLFYPLMFVNHIKHIDISANKIGNIGMFWLGTILRYNLNILELDLCNNVLNDNNLFFFLLGLGFYKLFKKDINNTFGELSEINEVTEEDLQMDLSKIIGERPKNTKELLEKIKKNFDFANKKTDYENKFYTMLIKLNLNNNPDIKSGEMIVDILKCTPKLKFLNIGRMPLGVEAEQIFSYLIEPLEPKIEKEKTFENNIDNEMSISYIINKDCESNINNKEYESNSYKFPIYKIPKIDELLSRKLQFLLLANIGLTEEGLKLISLIANGPHSNLKTINISDNKLSNYKVFEFFYNLAISQSIEELILKECDLPLEEKSKNTDILRNREAFLNFIKNCPNLKNLCLYYNKLESQDLFIDVFKALLERKYSINVFDYSKNSVKFDMNFKDKKNELIELLKKLCKKTEYFFENNVQVEFFLKENEENFKEKIGYLLKSIEKKNNEDKSKSKEEISNNEISNNENEAKIKRYYNSSYEIVKRIKEIKANSNEIDISDIEVLKEMEENDKIKTYKLMEFLKEINIIKYNRLELIDISQNNNEDPNYEFAKEIFEMCKTMKIIY